MSGVNKTYGSRLDEDSDGNIISQGFLMAKYLHLFFNSVFSREDIISLNVSDAKFQEAKSYYMRHLVSKEY